MTTQLKLVEDSSTTVVSALTVGKETKLPKTKPKSRRVRECWNCGRRHEYHKKELCPAYGKTCMKCSKPNHFAAKCHSQGTSSTIKAVGDPQGSEDTVEMFPM